MGGKAFEDVSAISLQQYKELLPQLENDLKAAGVDRIKPIGSSGKQQVMGDIDVAVKFKCRELLASVLSEHYQVKKFGASQIAVRYPFDEGFVQVDVMVGDLAWLCWARFGPCRSDVKGVVRNLLLNTILRLRAVGDDMDRRRLTIDWDKGLYEVVQTKRGKNDQPLAQWKTVESKHLTSDPDSVVNMIFGPGYSAQDILRFEDAVQAVKATVSNASEVLQSFVLEAEDLVQRAPRALGSEPQQALAAIKRIALG